MIERPRLLQLARTAHHFALEAPGGYGKTMFALAFAESEGADLIHVVVPEPQHLGPTSDEVVIASFRRALTDGGIRHSLIDRARTAAELGHAVGAAVPPDGSVVVLVDEAQRLDPTGIELTTGLARILAPPHRLVIAGREVCDVLKEAVGTVFDERDLAFDVDEVTWLAARTHDGRAVPTASWAHDLVARFNGWPTATHLALQAWSGRVELRLGTAAPAQIFGEAVEQLLARLEPNTRASVVALGQLPLVHNDLCDAAGGTGSWTALRASGLPLSSTGSEGWWKVSDPVREVLAGRVAMDPAFLERAAIAYRDAGRVIDGLRLLATAGLRDETASLIVGLSGAQTELLETSELRAVLHSLGEACVSRHPGVHLCLARLAGITGDIDEHVKALERARLGAEALGDAGLHRAVVAEEVRTHARNGEPTVALDLGRELLATVGDGELVTRARCLSGMGLAEATATAPGSTHRAVMYLTESAALARLFGDRGLESGALHWLGYWVHYSDGNAELAVSAQRQSIDLLPVGDRRRGVFATFLAEILVGVGRGAEAVPVLQEARRVGLLRGDLLTLAYAAWVEAEWASHRGDEEGVRQQLAEVDRHRGPWYEHSTGTDFLAAASEMWRRVDRPDEAARALDLTDGRSRGTVPSVEIARGSLECVFGDATAGERTLIGALGSPGLRRVSVPRILAARAVGLRRRGDTAGAARMLDSAHAAELAMGAPGMLAVVEALLLHRASWDEAAGAATSATSSSRSTPGGVARIGLLGRFAVVLGDDVARLPPGQASALLKRLAVTARPIAIGELLDAFWPEASEETGRRRLRNLLNRVREVAPGLIERRADSLALMADVAVDAHRFLHDAATALKSGDLEAIRSVAERYSGELLPEDRYEEWAVVLRERCTATEVALLASWGRAATRAGDHLSALLAHQRATELQPYEESHYVNAARSAVEAGQRGMAATLLERCRSVLGELEIQPGPDHAAIQRLLR